MNNLIIEKASANVNREIIVLGAYVMARQEIEITKRGNKGQKLSVTQIQINWNMKIAVSTRRFQQGYN